MIDQKRRRDVEAGEDMKGGYVAKVGCACLLCFFWHSEGWTARKEVMMQEVLQQIAGEPSPWLIACDANMEPRHFCEGEWCIEAESVVQMPQSRRRSSRKVPSFRSVKLLRVHTKTPTKTWEFSWPTQGQIMTLDWLKPMRSTKTEVCKTWKKKDNLV